MENLVLNSRLWDGAYDWSGAGEEWSESWGGSRAQWLGSIYPRISRLLPTQSVLEIAPGFGRWTRFLIPACSDYVGVDLSAECVEACNKRFSRVQHAKFVTNDGLSLSCARDGSVDFVFSFDSLVHASADVLRNYVTETLRVLKPDGVAFIHHSNWKAVAAGTQNSHGRGHDVAGEDVIEWARAAGGHVSIQERINWGLPALSDCLTVLRHGGGDTRVILNPDFMEESRLIREHISPYAAIG